MEKLGLYHRSEGESGWIPRKDRCHDRWRIVGRVARYFGGRELARATGRPQYIMNLCKLRTDI